MPSETRPTTSLKTGKNVLVDSNLLLLLVVGSWNPAAIAGFKRLGGLTFKDFDLLRIFLSGFTQIVTSSHVLAEVSNLAGTAFGESKRAIFLQFATLIETLDERFPSATHLSRKPEFLHFGLTDAALSALAEETILLTQDGRLASHLQNKGVQAFSLANIRALRSQANSAR